MINPQVPNYSKLLEFMITNKFNSITELSNRSKFGYNSCLCYIKNFEKNNIIRKIKVGRKTIYEFTPEGKYLALICKEFNKAIEKVLL